MARPAVIPPEIDTVFDSLEYLVALNTGPDVLAWSGGQGASFDLDSMAGSLVFAVVLSLGAVLCFALRKRWQGARGTTPHHLNNTGNLLAAQREFAEAIAVFTRALHLDPRFVDAYANRGAVYYRTAQYDEALADLDMALHLAPYRADAYVCRGHVHGGRGEFDAALADYNEALRLAPQNAGLLYGNRGAVWLARQEYDRAVADYNQALDSGSPRAPSLRDRGLAWYFKGDLDRAIADLDESIRLDATDAVAHNNRGAALLKKGAYSRAAADLCEAIRLEPDFANPYRHLAWLQATCPEPELRDGASAVAHAARAWRLSEGKNREGLEILAAAHAETGDFEEAVRWQSQYLAGSPPESRDEVQGRLDLYLAGQPFWDKPALRNPCLCTKTAISR